ncbi:phospholipid carrier-dependent glycosyltransferase [uncultured Sphingomonas sp.]|uniref:phospholipid carrier-dependent glycosyltransferase n=1 Tax=uncultured Sphingomonas sp. TaxID=158754 RepID=UPI0035CC88E4
MRTVLKRPLPAAIAIAAAAQLLFAWRLTTPHKLVFDEVHYVPAARTLASLAGPVNIEHPLLGKTIIALGILLFGEGPLGWRFFSSVAGTAVVIGVFAILWVTFGRLRPAVIGSLLAILNFTIFVQARIAMLDGFMAAFVVGAVAMLVWSMRGTGAQVGRRWLAGSVLLGLAVGTKWTAAPYVAFAAVAYVLLRRDRADRWPGLRPTPALAILGLASVGTYLATFAPAFFYATEPMTLAKLIPYQLDIYHQQTQVLPPHTYQSAWYSWPLDLRPIWYLYEPVDGAQRGILMLGNPVVIWGGLVAVLACLWGWARHRSTGLGAIAWIWIASVAMWAIIPKSLGFFYYYYLSSIWLAIAIAAALDRFGRGRLRYLDEAAVTLAAMLFVHFYPILAATALPGPSAFQRWMWLSTWP